MQKINYFESKLKVKTYNRVLGLGVIGKIYITLCGPFFQQVLRYLVEQDGCIVSKRRIGEWDVFFLVVVVFTSLSRQVPPLPTFIIAERFFYFLFL